MLDVFHPRVLSVPCIKNNEEGGLASTLRLLIAIALHVAFVFVTIVPFRWSYDDR